MTINVVGNTFQEKEFVNPSAPSLADMFLKKKRDLIEKYEHQKESKPIEKEIKPTRTKEELLKHRKAMMEYRKPALNRAKSEIDFGEIRGVNKSPSHSGRNLASVVSNQPSEDYKATKEPNPELLNRLAFGERAKVI